MNQCLHSPHALVNDSCILLRLRLITDVTSHEQLSIDIHHAKRLLQVMTCNESKLLELSIGLSELLLGRFLVFDVSAGPEPLLCFAAAIEKRECADQMPAPTFV